MVERSGPVLANCYGGLVCERPEVNDVGDSRPDVETSKLPKQTATPSTSPTGYSMCMCTSSKLLMLLTCVASRARVVMGMG